MQTDPPVCADKQELPQIQHILCTGMLHLRAEDKEQHLTAARAPLRELQWREEGRTTSNILPEVLKFSHIVLQVLSWTEGICSWGHQQHCHMRRGRAGLFPAHSPV